MKSHPLDWYKRKVEALDMQIEARRKEVVELLKQLEIAIIMATVAEIEYKNQRELSKGEK